MKIILLGGAQNWKDSQFLPTDGRLRLLEIVDTLEEPFFTEAAAQEALNTLPNLHRMTFSQYREQNKDKLTEPFIVVFFSAQAAAASESYPGDSIALCVNLGHSWGWPEAEAIVEEIEAAAKSTPPELLETLWTIQNTTVKLSDIKDHYTSVDAWISEAGRCHNILAGVSSLPAYTKRVKARLKEAVNNLYYKLNTYQRYWSDETKHATHCQNIKEYVEFLQTGSEASFETLRSLKS